MDRPRERLIVGSLLAITLLSLTLGFVRIMSERSLIPLELNEIVYDKRIRTEKHPGRDDVHILVLRQPNGALFELRVDPAVFDAIPVGTRIEKQAGDSSLGTTDVTLSLRPSPDAVGTRNAVASIVVLVIAVVLLARVDQRGA